MPKRIREIGGVCKHGHSLTGDNVYIYPKTGFVGCKTCRNGFTTISRRELMKDPVFKANMKIWQDAWVERNPEYRKRHWLNRDYKMTLEQYNEIIATQENKCPICFEEMKQPHVDHDHACCPEQHKTCGNCVRGIICHNCNLMLGKARDSEEILSRSIEYLRTYRQSREAKK
jgi:hypothetical protein